MSRAYVGAPSLRYLRKRAGLTQEEVASALGVNRITVLRWERGLNRPSSKYMSQMADLLGVPVSFVSDSVAVGA